jgi:rubrerythrin
MKNKLNEMMSTIPSKKGDMTDLQIIRAGIISEMDAISLYEQLSKITNSNELRDVLLSIAKEEKTHFGEFETLLNKLDTEQKEELNAGKKEVNELLNSDMKEVRERIYGKKAISEINEMKRIFNKLIK